MVDTKVTLGCLETATLILNRKSELMSAWETICRSTVPAAKSQTRIALRDSMPEFIEQLARTLRSTEPLQVAESNSEVAREHGEDRASQTEYDLEQVIYEYHLFRKVLFSSFLNDQNLAPDAAETIHAFIDHGIRKAAVTYAAIEASYQLEQRTELSLSRQAAERANLAKTAFLANMSHEIRTPLGAIMGFVSLLRDDDTTAEEADAHLEIIERHTHHLLRIVDDILDLTKVESGKLTAENIEFSLVQFLAEFGSFAGLKARENGLVFELRAETLVPETIVSDPAKLRQILSNSVGNAVKFTDKGKVELLVSFEDNHLNLKISDSGRGIASEHQGMLFQAFAQADSSSTRNFGGTGLGLILTKKLSQVLGGDFKLSSSELGVGSTFEASIPVGVPDPKNLRALQLQTIRNTALDKGERSVDLSALKVLLVEDSPDNQMLVKLLLGKVGIKLDVVGNGAGGVEAALQNHYDVILMDIQMPVMDGHEAARSLRLQGYSRPIVALTAHAMKEERLRAEQSGFSHFLTKPIHRKSLIDLLEILLVTLTASHQR